jgi:hypothetical protein
LKDKNPESVLGLSLGEEGFRKSETKRNRKMAGRPIIYFGYEMVGTKVKIIPGSSPNKDISCTLS